MTVDRPALPADLKRAILVEAGHRCAIPTCRHTTVEIAHIEPWARVKEHTFDNLIALCPNCHHLYDQEKKIDRKAMRQYKANLGLLHSRYGDFERRVLTYFVMNPEQDSIALPGGMNVALLYLLRDGYVVYGGTLRTRANADHIFSYDVVALQHYVITDLGRQFVTDWANANPL
ncbi:HNH endonuclease [Amycolatopsis vastitatis]|nr:HNH endonuclease signature motif containing protein [Amycolatopsis vastitatis]